MKPQTRIAAVSLALLIAVGGGAVAAQSGGPPTRTPEAVVQACMQARGFDVTTAELASTDVAERFDGAAYLEALHGGRLAVDATSPTERGSIRSAVRAGRRFPSGYSCDSFGAVAAAEHSANRAAPARRPSEPAPEHASDHDYMVAAMGRWQECMAAAGFEVSVAEDVAEILEARLMAEGARIMPEGRPRTDQAEDEYRRIARDIEAEVLGADERCLTTAFSDTPTS